MLFQLHNSIVVLDFFIYSVSLVFGLYYQLGILFYLWIKNGKFKGAKRHLMVAAVKIVTAVEWIMAFWIIIRIIMTFLLN